MYGNYNAKKHWRMHYTQQLQFIQYISVHLIQLVQRVGSKWKIKLLNFSYYIQDQLTWAQEYENTTLINTESTFNTTYCKHFTMK